MSISVSTFGQSNYLTSQILQLEAGYNNSSVQEASGLKSQDFAGIAGDSQNVLNLESQHQQLNTETTNATGAQSQVNTISSTLSNIGSVVTQALSNLSSAISNSNNTALTGGTVAQLQTDLSEITGSLNAQYAGNYLFGGSNINTPPVNINATGYTALDPNISNTSYYQGDSTIDSVQVNDSFAISYGITADNPAFEQALRGLTLAIASPNDQTMLQQAYGLLQQASGGVANLTATTSAKSTILGDQITVNQTALNYLNSNISDLTNADTTQVAVQLSAMQSQLNASYSVMSKLFSLSLTSFLK